jgi:hypothetical protein
VTTTSSARWSLPRHRFHLLPFRFVSFFSQGTLICIDPTRNVSLVLLTNRVYPNKTDQMGTIQVVRQSFANAVLKVLEGGAAAIGTTMEQEDEQEQQW